MIRDMDVGLGKIKRFYKKNKKKIVKFNIFNSPYPFLLNYDQFFGIFVDQITISLERPIKLQTK